MSTDTTTEQGATVGQTMAEVAASVAAQHAGKAQEKAQAKLDRAAASERAAEAKKARDKRNAEIVRVVKQAKPENRPASIERLAAKHGVNVWTVRRIAQDAGLIEKGQRATGAAQSDRDAKVVKCFNDPKKGAGSLRKTGELMSLPTSTVYGIIRRAGLMEGRTRGAALTLTQAEYTAIAAAVGDAMGAHEASAANVIRAYLAGRIAEPAAPAERQGPSDEDVQTAADQLSREMATPEFAQALAANDALIDAENAKAADATPEA